MPCNGEALARSQSPSWLMARPTGRALFGPQLHRAQPFNFQRIDGQHSFRKSLRHQPIIAGHCGDPAIELRKSIRSMHAIIGDREAAILQHRKILAEPKRVGDATEAGEARTGERGIGPEAEDVVRAEIAAEVHISAISDRIAEVTPTGDIARDQQISRAKVRCRGGNIATARAHARIGIQGIAPSKRVLCNNGTFGDYECKVPSPAVRRGSCDGFAYGFFCDSLRLPPQCDGNIRPRKSRSGHRNCILVTIRAAGETEFASCGSKRSDNGSATGLRISDGRSIQRPRRASCSLMVSKRA
jgi:hypothetical protein